METGAKKKETQEYDGPDCPFTDVNNKDVRQKIMKYLAARDVVSLGATSRQMRPQSSSDVVWFDFLQRDYGVQKDPVFDKNMSNLEIYKEEKKFEQMLKGGGFSSKRTWNLEKDLGVIFLISCEEGMIENVKCCIRRGVNIKVTLDDEYVLKSWTALRLASSRGHTPIVELLINKGVKIDEVNNAGDTALMDASLNGYTPVVELLVNNGAKIDQVDNDGWTALICASINGYSPVVKVLLNKGANIDHVDKWGLTALIYASSYGYTPVVKLLLNSGANIDQVDKRGLTALMYASLNRHKEVVELLHRHKRQNNLI